MPRLPAVPNVLQAMSAFRPNYQLDASSSQLWGFVCFSTRPAESVLHCFTALVKRRITRVPARGSKSAPAGAGAAATQERARGSGGARECKMVRASIRMAGEPDKMKTAASAKVVSAPLGKYFKTKAHSDQAVKQNETNGNIADTGGTVESSENILSGDFLVEREDRGVHKEPLQAVNSDPTHIPAYINLPTEEKAEVVYEEGRKSEPSSSSAPRDISPQTGAQVLTQALVQDLLPVNMGEKLQKGELIQGKRGLTLKSGQDTDLGDTFFSLSDQSSWSSDEATESKEGSSRAWKTFWSKAGSETTTPGEDEDENYEWGIGPGKPESFKVATLKKR
ncbi:hypothetical protein NDU88_003090 [Pleurodeles waltl]|uniref:Uncharacterized protein n=1 Tax=Pleurodeles waltl TaxID=8319 RepID=A0AAV7MSF1_PLEWA|nr:hypothetical protein NDU88_003090 [Pleurodeles waltl]